MSFIKEVSKNPRSMSGKELPSTDYLKTFDHCCGIHGAARERKGLKHAKVTARRRVDKEIVEEELSQLIADAALAEEMIDYDELEEHAQKLRDKEAKEAE